MLLGLVIGLLRGGRLDNLLDHPFRHLWLVLLPFALRGVIYFMPASPGIHSPWVSMTVQVLAYGSLLVLVVINRSIKGVPLIGLGITLNALAIVFNNGRMPVSPEGLARIGGQELVEAVARNTSYTHQLAGESVRLYWLTDIWPLPRPFPLPTVFSIGDVLIALGALVLLQHLMQPRRSTPYILPPAA